MMLKKLLDTEGSGWRFSVLLFIVALSEALLWSSANFALDQQKDLDEFLVCHAQLLLLTGITPDSYVERFEEQMANETKLQLEQRLYIQHAENQYHYESLQPPIPKVVDLGQLNSVQRMEGTFVRSAVESTGNGKSSEGKGKNADEADQQDVIFAQEMVFANGGVAVFNGAYAQFLSMVSATLCVAVWVSAETIPLFLTRALTASPASEQVTSSPEESSDEHSKSAASDSESVIPSSSVEQSPAFASSSSPIPAIPSPASPAELQLQFQHHISHQQQISSPPLASKSRSPRRVRGTLSRFDIPSSLPMELQESFEYERQAFPCAPEETEEVSTISNSPMSDGATSPMIVPRSLTPATAADDWRQATRVRIAELTEKMREKENHIAVVRSLASDVERYKGMLNAQLQMLRCPDSFDPDQAGLVEAALRQIQSLTHTVRSLEDPMEAQLVTVRHGITFPPPFFRSPHSRAAIEEIGRDNS